MPRFRKKPIVVEAVRFDPWDEHRLLLPPGVEGIPPPSADNWGYAGCVFFVKTIQGQRVEVRRGEWIISEGDGVHFHPCDPIKFAETYEPVD